jgi:hypothetical protein
MSDIELPDAERRRRARALAEQALDQYAAGNREEADRLADEAAELDLAAVEELLHEIEEDDEAQPEDEEEA